MPNDNIASQTVTSILENTTGHADDADKPKETAEEKPAPRTRKSKTKE